MQKRRENQKWVSHNKVLIGSGDGVNKKPHARNPNFDSEETKLLIQLWGNKDVQRQLITVHKKHPVISKIAEKMRVYGYNRSTEEINTRIKNLKCLYNRIKKDLDSGLLNEPSWKHFHSMDEILSRPVFGNSSSNKHPSTNKIIISPSSTSMKSEDQHLSIYHLKEEEISDDEEELEEEEEEEERRSMDFEGSELRPEDLLSVIETEHDHHVQIKEEPMDDCIPVIETKTNEKPDADSSTDLSLQNDDERKNKIINCTSLPLHVNKTNSIINYANEALSITSVHGNNATGQETSSKLSNQASSKISLVPTKLLLKSQGTLSSFKSTSHVVVPTSVSTNPQTQGSTSVPMKVVFVNALNSNHNAQQSITKQQQISLNKSLAQLHAQGSNSTFITNKIIQSTSQQQQATGNQLLTPNSTASISSSTPKPNSNNVNTNHHHQSSGKSNKSFLGNSKLPVIRNLLTNIVDIENQRLEIEKQRFEYEKKVGNELLLLIRSFVQHLPHEKVEKMDNTETTE